MWFLRGLKRLFLPKWSSKDIQKVLQYMKGTDCLCPNDVSFAILKPDRQPKTYRQLKLWFHSVSNRGRLPGPWNSFSDDRDWVRIVLFVDFKDLPKQVNSCHPKIDKLVQYRLRNGI